MCIHLNGYDRTSATCPLLQVYRWYLPSWSLSAALRVQCSVLVVSGDTGTRRCRSHCSPQRITALIWKQIHGAPRMQHRSDVRVAPHRTLKCHSFLSVPFREESHRVGISGLYRRSRDRSLIDLEAQAPSTSADALDAPPHAAARPSVLPGFSF